MAERGEFSVYVWFEDSTYIKELEYVDMKTAVSKAVSMTSNVAAHTGITRKVMITDGGDCSVFEWEYGKGVTHDGSTGELR